VVSKVREFGQTSRLTITVLVDNRADLLVRSREGVQRFKKAPLLAEHGFSALVELDGWPPASRRRILWDAGMTQTALLHNVRQMEIDLSTIDAIALSHGHGDHTAALSDVLRAIHVRPKPRRWEAGTPDEEILAHTQVQRVPLVAHPAAFRERWGIAADGTRQGPIQHTPRAEWEALGAEVILGAEPYQLGPGCWTTGLVPLQSFESGVGGSFSGGQRRAYREGTAFLDDHLEDDQAIAVHVAGKGLVVLSGCAHRGIVNTVQRAREISGVERVWAILGGFHLAPASDEAIAQTVDAVIEMKPRVVMPLHCTGFRAIAEFARRMPEAFVEGAVGTKLEF
jgi:7,8-dihydropterin-6-yl-methyl-4-(beta-D-ribofuranosyl)aminobenzene 5'-phosphate synthase